MSQELINIILIVGIAYLALQLLNNEVELFQDQDQVQKVCNTEAFMKRWNTYIKSINTSRYLPIDSNLNNMIYQIRQSGCVDTIIADIEKVKKGTGEYIKFIIENTQFGYTPQGFEDVDEVTSFLNKWNTYLSSLINNDSLNPFTDNVFASMITEIRSISNKNKLYQTLNTQYIKKTPGKDDIFLGDVINTIIQKTTIGVSGQTPQVVSQQAAEDNVAILTPESQYQLQQGQDSQSIETQISQQPMVLDAGALTQISDMQMPQMNEMQQINEMQMPQTVVQTPELTTQRGQMQLFQNTERNAFNIGASNLIVENGYYTDDSLKRDFNLQTVKPILTEQYKDKPFGIIEGGHFSEANF